jgi:glycosyltransferase involved in cell wall biosynthesis
MRIAFITPGFSAHSDDWAIPALLNLARTLAQENEVHVFSQRYPAAGIYRFDNLTHYALGGGQKFGLASLRLWLQSSQAIIRRHQKTPFDLLHAFWVDEAGFAAALAGLKIKRPVIASLGGGELSQMPDIQYGAQRFLARRLTTRLALKKATIVTAGSNYQLDLCRRHHIPKTKLRLAPLGVDTHHFQPPFPTSQSPNLSISCPTLIQAASLLPVKNQALLFEILRQVKQDIPHIKLNLAGSGPLQDELARLAQQLDVSQNIAWHGHIPYTAISRLYRQSHLYLQTSRHESQGIAVLEAMACGLPVLGTPVGAARDVVCRPATISAEILAGQVVELLQDAATYTQLSRQARQEVEANYSLSITTQNFINIYTEATKT